MDSGNRWADQWDNTNNNEEYNNNSESYGRKETGNGKMAKVKVVAVPR